MRKLTLFFALATAIIILFVVNLFIGTVSIPADAIVRILLDTDYENEIYSNIVLKSRLPQSLTSVMAGAGLAVSGLQMQVVFHNPLAGPSVLGVSNGASLGVALVVLLSGSIGGVVLSRMGYMGDAAMSVAAIVGALSVMALILFVAQKVRGNVTLLIIGVMIGYLATAVIGVLKFFSAEEDVRAYVVWGLGSFSRVSGDQITLFVLIMCLLLSLSMLLIKPMNMLMLGEDYAQNLGLNVRRARTHIILSSGILAAIVTAYCGPIMFIGLAVPHLCRALFRTSDNRILMPGTLLLGTTLALLCNLIARFPGLEGALPVNSVTAIIGAPVIAAVIFNRQKTMH